MPSGSKRYSIIALAYNKRGRLLSVGRNTYTKTHPLQAKYGKLSGRPHGIFLHAEIDALIKARGHVAKLVVLRFNALGQRVMAKPCPSCQLAINDFHVKEVFHS